MKELKIGFPSGSLKESTFDLFVRAGYRVRLAPRSYVPDIDDHQLSGLMFRAQEIAQYVARGVVDVGLTGRDWILESEVDVVEVAELTYSKSTARPLRWVIAVPEDSPIQCVRRPAGPPHRQRAGRLNAPLLAGARRGGRGGVFVGHDRGQGRHSRAGGCRSRSDRDGRIA